ncbi:hypothetical protein P9112_012981 [Eukaryota sp. TZLM1-RC]
MSSDCGVVNLIRSSNPIFQNRSEAMVAAVHMGFISAGFQCVGGRNSFEVEHNFPKDWQTDQNCYSFKYKRSPLEGTIVLKLVSFEPSSGQIIVGTCLDGMALTATCHTLKYRDFVNKNVRLHDFVALYNNLCKLTQLAENIFEYWRRMLSNPHTSEHSHPSRGMQHPDRDHEVGHAFPVGPSTDDLS